MIIGMISLTGNCEAFFMVVSDVVQKMAKIYLFK